MLRTIVEDEEVKIARDAVTRNYPRAEESWMGLTWLLARAPENGTPLGSENIRLHKQRGISSEIPDITVLYTYTNNEVVIKSAKFELIEAEAADAPSKAKARQ